MNLSSSLIGRLYTRKAFAFGYLHTSKVRNCFPLMFVYLVSFCAAFGLVYVMNFVIIIEKYVSGLL